MTARTLPDSLSVKIICVGSGHRAVPPGAAPGDDARRTQLFLDLRLIVRNRNCGFCVSLLTLRPQTALGIPQRVIESLAPGAPPQDHNTS